MEKLIFRTDQNLVQFKPSNLLRQKLVHAKDKTPRHRMDHMVNAFQCSEDCTELNDV